MLTFFLFYIYISIRVQSLNKNPLNILIDVCLAVDIIFIQVSQALYGWSIDLYDRLYVLLLYSIKSELLEFNKLEKMQ